MISSSLRKQSKERPTARLMEAMQFGSDDLEMNRSGILSASQRATLQQKQQRALIFAVPTGILLLIGAIGYVILLVPKNAAVLSCVVICMLVPAYIGLIIWYMDHTQKLLFRTRVLSMQGVVERHSRTGAKGVTSYELRVHDTVFPLGKRFYDAFIEGEHYTLYYLPGILFPYLVSAESIDKTNDHRLSSSQANKIL